MSASLLPGTSMNVTLKGNYNKLDGPYKAKLKTFYEGSDETQTRNIEANVSKNDKLYHLVMLNFYEFIFASKAIDDRVNV